MDKKKLQFELDKRWLCDQCFDGGEEKSGPALLIPGSAYCFNCGIRCGSGMKSHEDHGKYMDCHNVGFNPNRVKPERLNPILSNQMDFEFAAYFLGQKDLLEGLVGDDPSLAPLLDAVNESLKNFPEPLRHWGETVDPIVTPVRRDDKLH